MTCQCILGRDTVFLIGGEFGGTLISKFMIACIDTAAIEDDSIHKDKQQVL